MVDLLICNVFTLALSLVGLSTYPRGKELAKEGNRMLQILLFGLLAIGVSLISASVYLILKEVIK